MTLVPLILPQDETTRVHQKSCIKNLVDGQKRMHISRKRAEDPMTAVSNNLDIAPTWSSTHLNGGPQLPSSACIGQQPKLLEEYPAAPPKESSKPVGRPPLPLHISLALHCACTLQIVCEGEICRPHVAVQQHVCLKCTATACGLGC